MILNINRWYNYGYIEEERIVESCVVVKFMIVDLVYRICKSNYYIFIE